MAIITSPKAGDIYCAGGTMPIRWTQDADTAHDLYIAVAGSPPGNVIELNVTGDSYDWEIPAGYDGTNYQIGIKAAGSATFEDWSDPITIDSNDPTVSWSFPHTGDTLSGTVMLSVVASDTASGVQRVEFYYRYGTTGPWQLIGYDSSEPWQIPWDTTCVFPDGSYQLKAVAYDACGNTAEATVTVTVENLPDHYVQVLLDDHLCIPPQKPDAEQIVDFKVCAEVTNINVFPAYGGTKLLILGKADIEVLYVADVPTQSVHTAHFSIPFKTFLQWKNDDPLDPCAALEPVIVCEHVDYKLIDPRTIEKYIVLFIGIKAVTPVF